MESFKKLIENAERVLDESIVKMGRDAGVGPTSLMGYMPGGVTYKQLYDVFGTPTTQIDPGTKYSERDPSDKISVYWRGTIDGEPFTIYDYKSEIPSEHNTEWHIGGRKKDVVEKVIKYFNSKQQKED